MKINEFIDSREMFNRTWLCEEPEGTGISGDLSSTIFYNIDEIINTRKYEVTNIGQYYRKLEAGQLVYYWFENNEEKIIGVELSKKPQGLFVNMIGKNLKYKNKQLYASDLYNIILNDRKNTGNGEMNNLVLSDSKLSDEGFKIWEKLLKLGHNVIIFNIDNPHETFEKIETIDDMKKYFKMHDQSYGKYRYALSESGGNCGETMCFFRTRQARARNNLL